MLRLLKMMHLVLEVGYCSFFLWLRIVDHSTMAEFENKYTVSDENPYGSGSENGYVLDTERDWTADEEKRAKRKYGTQTTTLELY